MTASSISGRQSIPQNPTEVLKGCIESLSTLRVTQATTPYLVLFDSIIADMDRLSQLLLNGEKADIDLGISLNRSSAIDLIDKTDRLTRQDPQHAKIMSDLYCWLGRLIRTFGIMYDLAPQTQVAAT